MIHFFKKHIHHGKSGYVLAIVILTVASLFPLIHTIGTLRIGGDTIIPLIPQYALQNAFDWIDYGNGIYYSTDLGIWVGMFYILQRIGLDLYMSAFVFQFLIFFFSGLGIYHLYNLFNTRSKLWGIIPALAFIYSPHRYDHMIYFYGTSAIIWIFYFFFKFIRNKTSSYGDVVRMAILVGLIGNLPNPKYHFAVALTFIITMVTALYLKILSLTDLKKNFKYLLLLLLSTTYLSIPYFFYGTSFFSNTVEAIKTTNPLMKPIDHGIALVSKMVTLWHSAALPKVHSAEINSILFLPGFYLLAFLVLAVFPFFLLHKKSTEKRILTLFYLLAVIFVFLAKGSNPPFGSWYAWLITTVPVFAFLRTTAGMVLFAGIWYSLILGSIVQTLAEGKEVKRFPLAVAVILVFFWTSYTILTGNYFKNFSPINKWIPKNEYGLRIPRDYFEASAYLSKLKLDTKVRILPNVYGYQNNLWGYFGPIIYPWIMSKPTVFFDPKVDNDTYNKTITTRYILHDKTLVNDEGVVPRVGKYLDYTKPVHATKIVTIYRNRDKDFRPRFYLPDSQGSTIEYKRINPTKYRVIVHKAPQKFRLVFTDNYHPLWKIYPLDSVNNAISQNWERLYSVDPANTSDQATSTEVEDFIKKGELTILSDASSKSTPLKFVSKKFYNTIQNDNMQNGPLFETLFQKPIEDSSHRTYQDLLHVWDIDSRNVCATKNCIKDQNGDAELSFVVEFWPERLTYLAYAFSGLVLLGMSLTIIQHALTRHPKQI